MDDGARMTLWSLVSRSTCGSLVSIFCFSLFRSWWWYTGDGDVGLEVNMFLGYTGESDGGRFGDKYIVGGIYSYGVKE